MAPAQEPWPSPSPASFLSLALVALQAHLALRCSLAMRGCCIMPSGYLLGGQPLKGSVQFGFAVVFFLLLYVSYHQLSFSKKLVFLFF